MLSALQGIKLLCHTARLLQLPSHRKAISVPGKNQHIIMHSDCGVIFGFFVFLHADAVTLKRLLIGADTVIHIRKVRDNHQLDKMILILFGIDQGFLILLGCQQQIVLSMCDNAKQVIASGNAVLPV